MRSPSSAAPRKGRRRKPVATDVVELNFNDEGIPPRTGEPTRAQDADTLLSRSRAAPAGNGGAISDGITADDLAPETLLDDDGVGSPARRRQRPSDTVLRRVSEDELRVDLDDPAPQET